MNNTMKSIISNIKSGKDLEKNIPEYMNRMMTFYKCYSTIGLTMHYYTFYEMNLEEGFHGESEIEAIIEDVNHMISDFYSKNRKMANIEEKVEHINCMRDKVMKRMQILTAYTDIFQIYEYVLNRCELKFENGLEDIDVDSFTNEILQYILEDNENAIINMKIQDVTSQLPVRLTKGKFFDLLNESLNLYLGSDSESLDTYLYMIKSVAMLDLPEGMEQEFPELEAIAKDLQMVDYKNITKDLYTIMCEKLQKAVGIIETHTNVYYSLQEIINDLYTLILAEPYAFLTENQLLMSSGKAISYEDMEGCGQLIAKINDLFMADNGEEIPEELTAGLELVEGLQEEIMYQLVSYEGTIEEIQQEHKSLLESLMLTKVANSLEVVMKLQSNSLFVELEKKEMQTVEADDLENVKLKLVEDFTNLFENNSQVVNRAVMAGVLGNMPVFFSNVDEIAGYIRNSLSGCKDLSEKIVSARIIRDYFN